jgi:UDP-N-acetylglucosamine--N-acetylmuramyl-(pentapeptide) pyrophosphoryl-undecaprenol N-acetylglucosamine transferase
MTKATEAMGINPEEHLLNPFIDRMALAYAAADLVVARAGALTLAELTALGRPSVLVPLPTSAGNHQALNARKLAQSGAAAIIEETDPQASEKLEKMLEKWAEKPETLRAMAEAARAQGRPEAAKELANIVLDVVFNRT